MDTEVIDGMIAALELAKEDEALATAIEENGAVAVEMADDGTVSVNAGEESVEFSPEALSGEEPEVEEMPEEFAP